MCHGSSTMNWLDRPVSAKADLISSEAGLGIAAAILGRHVGIDLIVNAAFVVCVVYQSYVLNNAVGSRAIARSISV